MNLLEALGVDGGVDLRRREARVAEQLLDGAQVGAVVQQMSRERMTQRVRADVGADAGVASAAANSVIERATTQGTSASTEKDRVGEVAAAGRLVREFRTTPIKPKAQTMAGFVVEGNCPFLVAFADDPQEHSRRFLLRLRFGGGDDVGQSKSTELRRADAGGVEQLEGGTVAEIGGTGTIGDVEQGAHLVFAEGLRQVAATFRGRESVKNVGRNGFFFDQKSKERAHGGEATVQSSLTVPCDFARVEEGFDALASPSSEFRPAPCGHEIDEEGEIATVGVLGVTRPSASGLANVKEQLDVAVQGVTPDEGRCTGISPRRTTHANDETSEISI